MLARELISDKLPPLRYGDSVMLALSWMEELRVSHLPVVEGGDYQGLVCEEDLFDYSNPQLSLKEASITLHQISVEDYRHTLDVLRFIAEAQVTVLPVLHEGKYLGSIVQKELMLRFASIWSFRAPGSVVVLELAQRDFSVAKISHIVENQNTGIMSLYADTNNETGLMEVTIKFNKMDLSPVEAAFLQYGYKIKALYHESPDEDDIKLRYQLLMSYISV